MSEGNQGKEDRHAFTAAELANYVVCPEAWRLKFIGAGKRKTSERSVEGQKLRGEWVQRQELSAQLTSYAKVAYLLMVMIVIVVFLAAEQLSKRFERAIQEKTRPRPSIAN